MGLAGQWAREAAELQRCKCGGVACKSAKVGEPYILSSRVLAVRIRVAGGIR